MGALLEAVGDYGWPLGFLVPLLVLAIYFFCGDEMESAFLLLPCLFSHEGFYPSETVSQNTPFGHGIFSQQQKIN